jgi:transposase
MATITNPPRHQPEMKASLPDHNVALYRKKYGSEKRSGDPGGRRTGVSRRTGSKHPKSDSQGAQRRGRPKKISDETIQKMIQMWEQSAHSLSWEELGQAVGVEGVHFQTIRNHMVNEGYCKRIACQKRWLPHRAIEARLEYARAHEHWQNEWRSVLFSDEVHFGLWTSRKAKVISKRDEKLCEDCQESRGEQDTTSFHCWAMVGFHYKSPLVFFGSSDGSGAAFTPEDYISRMVRPHVQPVASTRRMLLLEGDALQDSTGRGHNAVQVYMDSVHLARLRNPPCSPDLNIMKDVLLLLKKRLQKRVFRDESDLKAGILEEWEKIPIQDINKLVDSMKGRMEEVISKRGKPI